MKRRNFIKKAGLLTVPTMIGGIKVSNLTMSARFLKSFANIESNRTLVLIDLNGGNDGLNSFVPIDVYDQLANVRPQVLIPQNKLLPFSDKISLHPAMSGIKNLFDDGQLSVIQGVGYPNQNRSHFRSADIWNKGIKADENTDTGWLGRYLDDEFPNYPEDYPNDIETDPFAITMGGVFNSQTCEGMLSSFSLSLLKLGELGGLTPGLEGNYTDDYYGDQLAFLNDRFRKSNIYAVRLEEAADIGYANDSLYPETDLAQQLKTVCRLISGGLQTRIYVLSLGGFDTHEGQVDPSDPTKGAHAELLTILSEAIAAFQQDLRLQNLDHQVLGMTFSEFGRRIIANASYGTDHGSAAPMILFGSCLNQRIIGDNPEIANDVDPDEGVPMQYDFKSVFGSVLVDWFNSTEEQVRSLLIEDFQYIPIIGNCSNPQPQTIPTLNVRVHPNPFKDFFKLIFILEKESLVKISLSDVLGKDIQLIAYRNFKAGKHRVIIEGLNLTSGVYFARTEVGNVVKTIRVVKG